LIAWFAFAVTHGIAALALIAATDVNYLVVDVRTREVVEQHWADAETPIPVGSLVKPFTALAYGGEWPEFVCKGTAGGCWSVRGHGRVRFREALADSCNAYFLNLARAVPADTLAVVAAKFGIPGPDVDTAEARIGMGRSWKISPLALARAYCELASRAVEPRVKDVLEGLRVAAESGTARAIGRGRMAKTGTAPCVAEKRDTGDGFTVVLDPADAPRRVLLVQVHGVPGAEAAKSAARILRAR
jgi:cell division protein FtsI/penicillin-binding protein 2